MPEPRRAFMTLLGLHLRLLRPHLGALMIFTLALPLAFAAALNALPTIAPPFAPGTLPMTVDPVTSATAHDLRAALIIAPAVVVALLGAAWGVLTPALARMREGRQFGFVAGFAVGRTAALLAPLVAYGIAAVPGVVLVPLICAALLHAPLHPSLWVIGAVPLAFAALAATGASLGLARFSSATVTALATIFYSTGLGLLWLLAAGLTDDINRGHLLALLYPSSLAADLLIGTLPHAGTIALGLDIGGLLLTSGIFGYLAYRLVPWRAAAVQGTS